MSFCTILGCGANAKTRGMCVMHYARFRKSEEYTRARPEDWGQRNKHPQYEPWRSMVNKRKFPDGHPWLDFWVFIKDTSNKPEGKSRILPVDKSQPVGPENFKWAQIQISAEDTGGKKSNYTREYRKMHPERFANYELKRHFGIDIHEYNRMVEAQNGRCGICGKEESSIHKSKTAEGFSYKVRKLAVDHCHETGKVRALLCIHCNRGLGCFKDNEEILFAAIEYLEKYRKLHASE